MIKQGASRKPSGLATRWLLFTLCVLIGIFIGFGLVQLSYIGPTEATQTQFAPVNYSDYVTILLTAITVLLAVMGTMFALLAIVGYQVIRSAALREATNEVLGQFESDGEGLAALIEHLETNKQFQDKVADALSKAGYSGISTMGDVIEDGADEQPDG